MIQPRARVGNYTQMGARVRRFPHHGAGREQCETRMFEEGCLSCNMFIYNNMLVKVVSAGTRRRRRCETGIPLADELTGRTIGPQQNRITKSINCNYEIK